MPTVITRSALVAWGRQDIPADLALIEIDLGKPGRHVVTWTEVMERRRARQSELLRRKRKGLGTSDERRAYKVWVAYFDQWLMGGWQAMIEDFRGRHGFHSSWIDRDRRSLKPILMQAFPLVLPLGSEGDQWAAWKIAFAGQYERRRQDRKPLGVAYVWYDGRGNLEPCRPLPEARMIRPTLSDRVCTDFSEVSGRPRQN